MMTRGLSISSILMHEAEVVLREIPARTVIHEVGHFFGMDEDQIDEMGYA